MNPLLALAAVQSVGSLVSSLTAPPAPPLPPAGGKLRGGALSAPQRRDGFEEILRTEMAGRKEKAMPVQFAPEAAQKLAQRGTRLDGAQLNRLSAAAEEASLKGAQRALVLMDGMAYVVDLGDRTVVNVEDKNRLAGLGDLRVDAVVEAKS
ncbi:MAG: hypothetical protein HYZ11_15280 [Candidatus Tectomicrobia bacterium]|uniref:Flagellar protein n=1 Tax=Tectimicrobiota bacterium TaxID=2528274 RepID=A0A932MPT8_UNCTE|nr:hypothetical protein [Candidatus Tectomicrobia bacterium]